jgi:RHS repeat-associated protein
MTDGSGNATWTFDPMGRTATEQRTIGTVTNTIGYSYDLNGDRTSITYPNGTALTYNYDTAGRVAQVIDAGHGLNYVTGSCSSKWGNSACYAASGPVSSYLNGYDASHAGVTATSAFNSRLQPQSIVAQFGSTKILDLEYDFHETSSNNGELWTLTNSLDSTRTKNFTYDAYNRIAEYKTPGSSLWDVKYTIDAWGNLTQKSPQSGYGGEMLNTGAASNANQLPGFTYDGGTPTVGNITFDGSNNYTYDSENRIATVSGVTYLYDGDGNRVQKSNGESYWGGLNGEPLLETDNSGNATNEYVYFNGRQIARRTVAGGLVHYTFSDHLRSATVIADNGGSVQERYDYAPYGELHWSSGSDSNQYLFTGKKRDSETGDDYFGARYYRNNMGRFVTPDWSATPTPVPYATLSLNLYAYVGNNPVTGLDPDGHFTFSNGMPANLDNAESALALDDNEANEEKQNAMNANSQAQSQAQNQVTPQSLTAQIPGDVRANLAGMIKDSNSPTADDKTGGFHEEYAVAGTNASGGWVVSRDKPGPYANPDTADHVSPSGKPANQEVANSIVDPRVVAHVHPSGTTATHSWVQGPSGAGRAAALPGQINIVFGARDHKVYFYNNAGDIGKPMKLKDFLGQ